MGKVFNWGIIGLGNIAHKFAKDLLQVQDARLLGVATRNKEKATKFAEKYDVENYYDSYEALVKNPEIDVVYIATPHVFHFENTMLCLQNNKAVLCEKAFAMNFEQVQTMANTAASRNLFLMEAMWTRFIPATEKLITLIGEQGIGEVYKIEADFGFKGDNDFTSRLYDKKLGGGSLLDIGIYPIYLSLLLLGIPDKIQAEATFTSTKVDDSCTMIFEYKNNTKAFLKSIIKENTPIEAIIYGKKGTIKMHSPFHHSKKLTLTNTDNSVEELNFDFNELGYSYEIVEVMNCLKKGRNQSLKLPHTMSLDLIKTLDRVRKEIGLTY